MATLPPVLVIGAGVIGLSTAVTLAEAGHPVAVRTAEPPEATTSAVAGALWGPWLVQPRHRVLRWAEHTLTTLRTGAPASASPPASRSPIHPTTRPTGRTCCPTAAPAPPTSYPPATPTAPTTTVPLVDMPPCLTHRLTDAGGAIQTKPVTSLDDLAHSSPVIVNCAGLGARALVPDHHVHPVRGHHVIVTNPGLTDFIEADTGDSRDLIAIYPHPGHVVLGGTAEPGRWDRDPATGHAILQRCTRLESTCTSTPVERPSPTTTDTAEPASASPGAAPTRSPT